MSVLSARTVHTVFSAVLTDALSATSGIWPLAPSLATRPQFKPWSVIWSLLLSPQLTHTAVLSSGSCGNPSVALQPSGSPRARQGPSGKQGTRSSEGRGRWASLQRWPGLGTHGHPAARRSAGSGLRTQQEGVVQSRAPPTICADGLGLEILLYFV